MYDYYPGFGSRYGLNNSLYSLLDEPFFYDPYSLDFQLFAPKIEVNKECKLPAVGDTIYEHQTQALPVGSLLKSEDGTLYVRGRRYNTKPIHPTFLINLDGEEEQGYKWIGKLTILHLPEWPEKFEVGDVVSHAQAQLLPRFTVLVYEPDEWMKHHCPDGFRSGFQSHWFVTNEVVSARCGVVQPMNGKNHWATFYKIVYLPDK
jgi:hypothetical protein